MALENVRSLFISLIIPINRERLAPIVFLMLGSVRHTSEVFDKVISSLDCLFTENTKYINILDRGSHNSYLGAFAKFEGTH